MGTGRVRTPADRLGARPAARAAQRTRHRRAVPRRRRAAVRPGAVHRVHRVRARCRRRDPGSGRLRPGPPRDGHQPEDRRLGNRAVRARDRARHLGHGHRVHRPEPAGRRSADRPDGVGAGRGPAGGGGCPGSGGRADLRGSRLRGTHLRRTVLRGAVLRDPRRRDTRLRDALVRVVELPAAGLRVACGRRPGQLPAGGHRHRREDDGRLRHQLGVQHVRRLPGAAVEHDGRGVR
ncbi:pentapeptide repeat-containing protein [Pseudonocardia parietis]|uniref:pentapeptide repeat-containing protein n=1 Tax=Pseudonocardia parietis TaxID=570936 RepID=UPI003558C28F